MTTLKDVRCCKDLYYERKFIEGVNLARLIKLQFCPYCGVKLSWRDSDND